MAPQTSPKTEVELRCTLCGKLDVVPTMQRKWRDWLFKPFSKSPWVCRACGWRFYVKEVSPADPS